jgi:hypothetical protein
MELPNTGSCVFQANLDYYYNLILDFDKLIFSLSHGECQQCIISYTGTFKYDSKQLHFHKFK